MLKHLALIIAIAGCDADSQPLPACADVGCGSSAGFCTRAGVCSCTQNGTTVECQRAPSTFDAGVDSPSSAIHMFTTVGQNTSWDFGAASVGTPSVGLAITVSNDTADVTGVVDVHFSGDVADFVIDPASECDKQIVLAVGASCSLIVRFKPTSLDVKAASVIVDASPGGVAQLSLTGTGVAPLDLDTQPPFHDFGVIEFGQAQTATLQLVNTNGPTATINAIEIGNAIGGGFTLASTTCIGATLAPGDSCALVTKFDPQTFGQDSGTLTVHTSVGDYVQPANWLLGYGAARLTVNKLGAGTVNSDGGGNPDIACDPDCSGLFIDPTHTLTASGGVFAGWSDASCGSASTCAVTLSTSPTIISATFN